MREAAMMGKAKDGPFEASENIEVRGFRGKRQRGSGERRFTVESGTSHARAGQEVSDRFQAASDAFLCVRGG